MAGDAFAKVFDFESAFEAAGEEAAERGDEGGECCEDLHVEVDGADVDGGGEGEEGC